VTPDPSGLVTLTWGDREIIGAMFGADVLTTGRDAQGELIGIPPFVWLVIEDRRSGRLAVGSEITSSYLAALRDSTTGPFGGPPTEPFSAQQLDAALAFLGRRKQGATVDIRA